MVIGVLVNKCCLRRYDSLHVDVSTEKVIISHCYIKVCRLQICIHVSFVFLISKHGLFSINLHNPPPPHTHTHARTHTHTPTHTNSHTYVHTYAHARTLTHERTYAHTHTQSIYKIKFNYALRDTERPVIYDNHLQGTEIQLFKIHINNISMTILKKRLSQKLTFTFKQPTS